MTPRELNALVAEHIMGLSTERTRYRGGEMPSAGLPEPTPDYCHSIADAWEVLEKLKTIGNEVAIRIGWYGETSKWCVGIAGSPQGIAIWDCAVEECDTAPLAICLAALKAVGVEVPA